MKPMNASTEKTLARRATELGNSADPQALPELLELAKSVSPLVRRLAASGLGKLAGIVSAAPAVEALQPLLGDGHPQVRLYAAKALGAYGAAARSALPDLRDLYANPAERDYVKRSVMAAGKLIRAASDIADRAVVHCCQRCGVELAADE